MIALSVISSTIEPVDVTIEYTPRSNSILQISIIVCCSNSLYSITGLSSTLLCLQAVKQALISFLMLLQSSFSMWCGFKTKSIIDAIETLPNKLSKVIKQKFFYSMTMEEIGRKNHYSRETARRNVKRGLEKLKEICKSSWRV